MDSNSRLQRTVSTNLPEPGNPLFESTKNVETLASQLGSDMKRMKAQMNDLMTAFDELQRFFVELTNALPPDILDRARAEHAAKTASSSTAGE